MTDVEFSLALTAMLSKKHAGPAATLVDFNGNILAVGIDRGEHTYESAIVNLLHNISLEGYGTKYRLFASYEPRDMCGGMALTLGIHNIYYFHNSRIYQWFTPCGPGGRGQTDKTTEATEPFAQIVVKVGTKITGIEVTTTDLGLPQYKKIAPKVSLTAPVFNTRTLPENVLKVFGQVPADPATLKMQVSHEFFMKCAYALVGRTLERDSEFRGHNVGAILVDPARRIIGWGVNIRGVHPTLHAETTMALAYLLRNKEEQLPPGCCLYTTLEPCHMCSGFLTDVAKGLKVFLGMEDPALAGNNSQEKPYKTSLKLRTNGCSQWFTAKNKLGWSLQELFDPTTELGEGVGKQEVIETNTNTSQKKTQQKKPPPKSAIDFVNNSLAATAIGTHFKNHYTKAWKLMETLTLPGKPAFTDF